MGTRNAKIVCTLGPASRERETVRALAEAGMAVARLNASHGPIEERAELAERVRAVDAETDRSVATMVDLQGPEVRTTDIEDPLTLGTGGEVRFVEGDSATTEEVGLSVSIAAVEQGDRVLLDDGRIETTVQRVDGDAVVASVDSGGTIEGRTGVNIPGVALGLDIVTDADRRELEQAADLGVDFVAASFVCDAADVYAVGEVLEDAGADIPVVAKVERVAAVENLDGIVAAADGVMVARGDLGVECPLEDVPIVQKRIIRRCRDAGVPVITATEMLDSMVHERRPTRAETSDVANAVLDGTDAVMLSAETAVGDHPVATVATMDRIVRRVESSPEYDGVREGWVPAEAETRTGALARSARYLSRDVEARAVVTATESGYTARKTAKYRPAVPVVASTPDHAVRRRLSLLWGVVPRYSPLTDGSADAVVERAVDAALDADTIDSGDTVVVLSGMMTDLEDTDTTNTLKVHVAASTVATGRGAVPGRAAGPIARVEDGDLSSVPNGAVLVLGPGFDAEFAGDLSTFSAVVSAEPGVTGYAAMVARELGIPMVSAATLDRPDGTIVTVDGERGVVYEGDVLRDDGAAGRS